MNQKDLVLVDSTCRNLRRLALAVASQKPVLLEGPIGCGKTALVEFMAAVTGHTKATEILKVQLGDQTDSKVREHGINLSLTGHSLMSAVALEATFQRLKKNNSDHRDVRFEGSLKEVDIYEAGSNERHCGVALWEM